MNTSSVLLRLSIFVLPLFGPGHARAQCPEWESRFGSNGTGGAIRALTRFDDGSGPALYAGGSFSSAGSVPASNVARWDGAVWSALGGGITNGSVSALGIHDDGSGPALYAGGSFLSAGGVYVARVAKWDGLSWSALGTGLSGGILESAFAFAVFDDGSGPALFVGGNFETAGGVSARNIAKWDGSTWSALGNGVSGFSGFESVNALAVHDDGTGPALYVGGRFSAPANGIARWDGSTWSSVGPTTVFGGNVTNALSVFDDGSGPALYAGGGFTTIGGVSATNVARWDGSVWSPLGGGLDTNVLSFAVFDDGTGPALYAGGLFTVAGGSGADRVARWSGSTWSPLGLGTNDYVSALEVFPHASAPELYAGGEFTSAGGVASAHIGAWSCLGSGSGTPFCFGDGSGHACPCNNPGATGNGCENSASTGGARLGGAGGASLASDTVSLTSSGELGSAFSLFLQGTSVLASPVLFGDGLRCVGGSLKRLYTKNASGGIVTAPTGADPSVHARSAALGDPIPAGATRNYQVYYRDPSAGFCPSPPGGTFNASQALGILWAP